MAFNKARTKIVGVVLVVAVMAGCQNVFSPSRIGIGYTQGTATFSNTAQTAIDIVIADQPEEQAIGLGETTSLGENQGMLFAFSESHIPTFWMKGLTYSLDMIWLHNNTVVDITEHVQPELPGTPDTQYRLYRPNQSINQVLEVPGGFASKHDIRLGQRIELTNLTQ